MKSVEIILKPEEAFNDSLFRSAVYRKLAIKEDSGTFVNIVKRSIDARSREVIVRIQCEIVPSSEHKPLISYSKNLPEVTRNKAVVIVGSGPAGLFAGLRLIELGLKPIIIERGKDVQLRRRDLAAINKDHIVNTDSNYCFGEGGAGTYSDGKLYTRSKKRGDIRRILEILVAHGAKEDILYDAHPHIGTNKLPLLVSALRQSILDAGGEVHFNERVIDFIIEDSVIKGVVTSAKEFRGEAVILATGHSARDIFQLLHRRNVLIESKSFAIGVRVEHSQAFIDSVQYHCTGGRGDFLPASSYSLVHQAKINGVERGVFSFCMCPGGFIVPAATQPGEIVVNGMSPSRRDSRFANSGIVVAVDGNDFEQFREHGPLAGMYFQAAIEQQACAVGGGTQRAPAQRLADYTSNKISASLLESSYQPGLVSVDISSVLPSAITEALKQGFRNFGNKIKGYMTNEAQIVGVESRTSSPVKIPRDKDTLEHPQLRRLFPCGEGAGFAGGIVSAAMDGERCAEAAFNSVR